MDTLELEIGTPEIVPDRAPVLTLLGIPDEGCLHDDVQALMERSYTLFGELVDGRGLVQAIGTDEFAGVFRGGGTNDPDTPLEHIFPRAEALALYAVTIGEGISREITRLFEVGEYAAGSVLDAVASAGTERLSERVEQAWLQQTGLNDTPDGSRATLRYSPGYCGWHVKGQHAFFKVLEPGRIGIELLESSLMQPTKSATGVIVTGPRHIHVFDPVFPCCAACAYPTCRERIAGLPRGGSDTAGQPERRGP